LILLHALLGCRLTPQKEVVPADETLGSIGGILGDLATIGLDTTILDHYEGKFTTDVCLDIDGDWTQGLQECDAACSCHGHPPDCALSPTWDQIVSYGWKAWWIKWIIDIVNEMQKNARAEGRSLFRNPASSRPLPSNAWNRTSNLMNPAICAVTLMHALSQAYQYSTGSGCQENYLMQIGEADLFCGIAYAASGCGEVLQYAGPAYAAYVQSGARTAVSGAMATCAVGQWAASRLKCATAEKACMAGQDAATGVATTQSVGGSDYRLCCSCDRKFYQRHRFRRDQHFRTDHTLSVTPDDGGANCQLRSKGRHTGGIPVTRNNRNVYYRFDNCQTRYVHGRGCPLSLDVYPRRSQVQTIKYWTGEEWQQLTLGTVWCQDDDC